MYIREHLLRNCKGKGKTKNKYKEGLIFLPHIPSALCYMPFEYIYVPLICYVCQLLNLFFKVYFLKYIYY